MVAAAVGSLDRTPGTTKDSPRFAPTLGWRRLTQVSHRDSQAWHSGAPATQFGRVVPRGLNAFVVTELDPYPSFCAHSERRVKYRARTDPVRRSPRSIRPLRSSRRCFRVSD